MSDQASQTPTPTRTRPDLSSFTVPQYAALGLMAVAVVILGMWFMQWSTTPTWEVVASGLAPSDASMAVDELDSAGIENRLANGGTAVEVPTGMGDDARVAIGETAAASGGSEGYEILDDTGFLASAFRQRVDYQRAVEGELSRAVMAMEAIDTAIVRVAVPEDRLFADDAPAATASAVVGGQLNQGTVTAIANVIASKIPGLDPSNVTVADTNGRLLNGGGEMGMGQDQQLQMEDLYEAQLELAAQSMLATALGPGRAVVRVTADLNFDELEQQTVTYDAETQVTLRQQEFGEAYTGDSQVPLGTLGTGADVTDVGELAGEDGTAYLRQETNSEFGVPSTTTTSRQAPGQVERLTVAVLLDESVDPAPDPAVLSTLVAAAVGIDDARGDTIVVESMVFDEVSAEEIEEAAAALGAPASAGLEPIIGYAKTGVAIIAMILALLFLRKGLKTLMPVTREPVDIDPAQLAALTAGASAEAGGGVAADAVAAAAASTGSDGSTPALGTGSATTAASNGAAASSGPNPGLGPLADTTVDMFDLIDAQSDQVAHLLRDLVSDSVS